MKKQIQKNQRQKSQIRRERILEKWTQKNQIMKIQVQKKSGTENLMPEDPEPEKPDMEETKQESPVNRKRVRKIKPRKQKAPEKEEPTVMPDAGKSNTEKQEQTGPGQSSPEKEELKTDEQLPVAAATPEEVTQDPDDIPLQTEESSPSACRNSILRVPGGAIPNTAADHRRFRIITDSRRRFLKRRTLIIRPADTSVEIDPGYTPEICSREPPTRLKFFPAW